MRSSCYSHATSYLHDHFHKGVGCFLFSNWSFRNKPLPGQGKKEAITTTTSVRTREEVVRRDGEPEQQWRARVRCGTQGWMQPGQPQCCDQTTLLPWDWGQCWKKLISMKVHKTRKLCWQAFFPHRAVGEIQPKIFNFFF